MGRPESERVSHLTDVGSLNSEPGALLIAYTQIKQASHTQIDRLAHILLDDFANQSPRVVTPIPTS